MSEQKIEEFWRDATADDARGALGGKEISARYRKTDSDEWIEGCLYGAIAPGGTVGWYCYNGHSDDFFRQCQVYDPPEIHKNKPDPGEGWRLLEKSPPEEKEAGDEWFSYKTNDWVYAGSSKIQRADVWYRRRIANYPASSDSCRSRDTIPSGWRVLGKDEERLASDAYWSSGCKDWIVIGDDRAAIANELPRWHAIRQMVYYDHRELRVNGVYSTPGGQTIRITEKGFEVVR